MTQMLDFNMPAYPVILTRKNRDSEKSQSGKAQIKDIGIGNALKSGKGHFE